MASCIPTLGDDTEGVILQDRAAADTTQKALLYATVKTYNRDFRGGLKKADMAFSLDFNSAVTMYLTHNFDLYGDFPDSKPRNQYARRLRQQLETGERPMDTQYSHAQCEPELL